MLLSPSCFMRRPAVERNPIRDGTLNLFASNKKKHVIPLDGRDAGRPPYLFSSVEEYDVD